ncbi:MAG: YgjV family protein [Spirochaetaceae bacterium]|nr:YgjV family protein [Spirochaetaceae bacterium]
MNTSIIIEMVGYLGSALVLVSFLMSSVVKLRLVNSIGGFIFFVYALIIHSYPTAIMNLCLVIINIRFLIKIKHAKRVYELVPVDKDNSFLQYLLGMYSSDIQTCFPGISLDFSAMNTGYIVCCEGSPAAMVIGKNTDEGLELLLDYSIPQYRDYSIGSYMMEQFKASGIKKVLYYGPEEHHKAYLQKMNFEKRGSFWQRIL